MLKRVFVSLPISIDLQNKLEKWKKIYQNLPVRWIKPENLHVTLISPWYTNDIDEVIESLESFTQGLLSRHSGDSGLTRGPQNLSRVPQDKKRFWTRHVQNVYVPSQNDVGLKPFTITFRVIAFGPDPKRPRLIWLSGDIPPELTILKSKLEEVLQRKKEKRSFSPHLTIARFKEKDFAEFSIKNLHDKIFWEEKISSFRLMESHLSPKGAEYKTLLDVKLKAQNAKRKATV